MSTDLTIEVADAFLKDYAELIIKHGLRLTSTGDLYQTIVSKVGVSNAVVATREPDRQFRLEFVMKIPEPTSWHAVQKLKLEA